MLRNVPLLLIRVVVGIVFLTEGVLKFLWPSELGAGRFAHIGLPWPQVLAPVVGALEIAGEAAVLFNLYAGDAAIVLLCIILTAIVSTKLPILDWPRRGAVPAIEERRASWNPRVHS